MNRRCVFLDRDGVINVKAPDGEYIRTWSEFQLIPVVTDWIRLFNALDLLVIVVTNQRGVARNLVRADDLDEIHRKMAALLMKMGARIDDIFCCPHEADSCGCRKPATGLVRQAVAKWNIDVPGSLMIGDSDSDRQLAANCGMPFVQVANGRVVETIRAQ